MMRKVLAALALAATVAAFGPVVSSTEAAPPFHCNQVNLHPGTLLAGQEGVPYLDTLWLTPGNPALQVYVTNVSPALPTGLGFGPGSSLNRVNLSGTPAASTAGTYNLTIEVGGTYVLGTICKVTQTYTLVITP